MKRSIRLLVSVYLGFFIYLGGLLFWGQYGIPQMRKLNGYKRVLLENLDNLKKTNYKLKLQLESLRTSPDRVRLNAQSLGYFQEDQRIIKVEPRLERTHDTSIGNILKRKIEVINPTALLRGMGIAFATLFFLLSGYFGKQHGYKTRR